MKNKISVIVPVYNSQTYLEKCINSVLLQTLKEIELICVDDGSTDASVDIIRSYVSIDDRVKLIAKMHGGSGESRNIGIDTSNGTYISFMDSDDYYPNSDVLEKLYGIASKNKALICGGGIALDKGNIIVKASERGDDCCYRVCEWHDYKDSQDDYGYQRFIFSSKLLKSNKIYFPNHLRYQDPPFLVKTMIASPHFYGVDFDTYCYRMGHQNINWNKKKTEDLARGLYDVLVLASDNGLFKLFKRTIDRINGEYSGIFLKELINGNEDLYHILMEIEMIRFHKQNIVQTEFIKVLKTKV